MSERVPKEQFIAKNGFLIIHPVGVSMLPLLRGGRDTVDLAAPGEIRVNDVVWYRRADGDYVLHRVVGVENGEYVLCGDHQIARERGVRREDILGVMRGFYRGERYVPVENRLYRAYVALWSHMLLRRVVLKLMRICGK